MPRHQICIRKKRARIDVCPASKVGPNHAQVNEVLDDDQSQIRRLVEQQLTETHRKQDELATELERVREEEAKLHPTKMTLMQATTVLQAAPSWQNSLQRRIQPIAMQHRKLSFDLPQVSTELAKQAYQ